MFELRKLSTNEKFVEYNKLISKLVTDINVLSTKQDVESKKQYLNKVDELRYYNVSLTNFCKKILKESSSSKK